MIEVNSDDDDESEMGVEHRNDDVDGARPAPVREAKEELKRAAADGERVEQRPLSRAPAPSVQYEVVRYPRQHPLPATDSTKLQCRCAELERQLHDAQRIIAVKDLDAQRIIAVKDGQVHEAQQEVKQLRGVLKGMTDALVRDRE